MVSVLGLMMSISVCPSTMMAGTPKNYRIRIFYNERQITANVTFVSIGHR
jgi:hypothetical protein